MEKKSEDIWKEILNNQSKPLIGEKESHKGNGYHDAILSEYSFAHLTSLNVMSTNTLHTIYLRDLGLYINPSLLKSQLFTEGLVINNCSENYHKTVLKYLSHERYSRKIDLLRKLGDWGNDLCHSGRLIFEIIGWYDNYSNQFYAFNLQKLPVEFCTIKSKFIVFNDPNTNGKRVNIPLRKCIIIEFPKELGGYDGFKKVEKEVLDLGEKFNLDFSEESIVKYKEWDRKFNKATSKWGNNKFDNTTITEYYMITLTLRHVNLIALCIHELINGLKQLIEYLNKKLNENSTIEFKVQHYEITYIKDIQEKWETGSISFEEINTIIQSYR